MRLFGLGILILLLLASACNGLLEAIVPTHFATTRGMQIGTLAQILSGAAAGYALYALAFRRDLVFRLLIVWAIGGIVFSALAPVVYGGRSWVIGVISGLAATLVFGLALYLWGTAHSRG